MQQSFKDPKKQDKSKPSNNQKDKPKKQAPEATIKQKKAQAEDATPGKKPAKGKKENMAALLHTLPRNIEEQQALFFDNDCSINPQFEYDNYAATLKFLSLYESPSDRLMPIATKILNSFLKTYGTETAYLESEGVCLDQEETERIFREYIEDLGFSEQLTIEFKSRQIAPTSVTHDPKTCKSKVNIRLPCEYRPGRIQGVLDHEIGTHFLRRNNEKFQFWYKKREKHDIRNSMATEEGFACTNQLVR